MEEIEDTENNPKPKNEEDSEPCDCGKFVEKIDELLGEVNTIKEVLEIRSSYVAEQLGYEMSLELERFGQWLLEKYASFDNILGDLTGNFIESRENIFENSDKYYHMKAFCKVGQREDEISNDIASAAGWLREISQGLTSLIVEEKSWSEAVKEARGDINANRTGLEMGKQHPSDDCEIILKKVWPHDLKKNY